MMEQLELPFYISPKEKAIEIYNKARNLGANFSHNPIDWLERRIDSNTDVYLVVDANGNNSYFLTGSLARGIKM